MRLMCEEMIPPWTMMLQMAAIHVPDSGELTAFKSGTIYFVLKMMGIPRLFVKIAWTSESSYADKNGFDF